MTTGTSTALDVAWQGDLSLRAKEPRGRPADEIEKEPEGNADTREHPPKSSQPARVWRFLERKDALRIAMSRTMAKVATTTRRRRWNSPIYGGDAEQAETDDYKDHPWQRVAAALKHVHREPDYREREEDGAPESCRGGTVRISSRSDRLSRS